MKIIVITNKFSSIYQNLKNDFCSEMSRHDFTRDPCPWRLVEDMGGAYSMGLVGGGIWAGGKAPTG